MIPLIPGNIIRRTDLHAQYGGRRQGGISPSKVSNNVFLITDPDRGERHGYLYDGPREDGYFHYTGEGQYGDQLMAQGNRAIRDHEAEGRDLQLFSAHGTDLTYVGQYAYVDDYTADAPETNHGPPRSVIVFRLEQLQGISPGPNRSKLDRLPGDPVTEIPVEQAITESTLIEGDRDPYMAERREQKLVRDFSASLEQQGHAVCRLQIRPPKEPAPIFCDLYDKTTNTLYEAKGTVARQAIRMAIGQLADYARLVDPSPRRVLLVPQQPRHDLCNLLAHEGIEIVWREGDQWLSLADGKRAPTPDGRSG
ncbi:MAG TPA: hypothetical protein VNY52_13890 [Solirubrobacteraceae bacterium]|nr:hypothetical protein [Solirubrobacteraceae bacterium]